MRLLALLLVLISLPALAADYTPWSDADGSSCAAESLLAQATGQGTGQGTGQTPTQPQGQNPGRRQEDTHPGRYCCRHCRHNELPCGGVCIAAVKDGKKNICQGGAGCACPGAP